MRTNFSSFLFFLTGICNRTKQLPPCCFRYYWSWKTGKIVSALLLSCPIFWRFAKESNCFFTFFYLVNTRSGKRVVVVGQNFIRSLNRVLTLSPRYVMFTCQRWGVGRRGWRVGEAKRLGEGRVRTFWSHELAYRSLWFQTVNWRNLNVEGLIAMLFYGGCVFRLVSTSLLSWCLQRTYCFTHYGMTDEMLHLQLSERGYNYSKL